MQYDWTNVYALRSMLSMGSSKPWPEAMRVVTGQDKMDAGAFREYFKPLEMWLIAKNKEMGEAVGWEAGIDINQEKTIFTYQLIK